MSAKVRAEAGKGEVGDVGDNEPPAKKSRHTSDADAPTARRDLGGPIEDEAVARKKLAEAGFETNDVTKKTTVAVVGCDPDDYGCELMHDCTPMFHFCCLGDLKMCRYLLSRGASTTDGCDSFQPMYGAAMYGHLDACKWLYDHGAEGSVKWVNDMGYGILRYAPGPSAIVAMESRPDWFDVRKEIVLWLIFKGAFSSTEDDSGRVDSKTLRASFSPKGEGWYGFDHRSELLSWARRAVDANNGFQAFLWGTFVPLERHLFTSKSLPPCRRLNGMTNILMIIAEYVGVERGRNLRILRGLALELAAFIQEVPYL